MKIAVIGAGSWGTALAQLLAAKGFPVDLWVFEKEICERIQTVRENDVFLPGVRLSSNITPSNNLDDVVSGKDIIVIVVPSHVMRSTAGRMAPNLSETAVVVSASKGIENGNYLTMSGVLRERMPHLSEERLAVLSGPSFAKEVAARVPTAVTLACKSRTAAETVQTLFATPYFRVYTHSDIVGVEVGGSVKNVIAIASGIIDGLGLGLNTRAALITRGLVEMRRLGLKLGANPRTFTGVAGVGDLVLTCTGTLSRNHSVGKRIGEGAKLAEILSEMRMVAEGVKTAESVFHLSNQLGVEMPICREIYRILYEDVSPKEAVHRLMTRDLKQELDEY